MMRRAGTGYFAAFAMQAAFTSVALFTPARALVDQAVIDDTLIYDQAYFSSLRPVTALDMVREIPGGDQILPETDRNGDARGLGEAADSVLINGVPFTGKPEDAVDALEQIPAAQVVRIEILRTPESTRRGDGSALAVNVVLRDDGSERMRTAGSWQATLSAFPDDIIRPGGRASYRVEQAVPEGTLSLNGSVRVRPRDRRREEVIETRDIDGTLEEIEQRVRARSGTRTQASGALAYEREDGRALRLNLEATLEDEPEERRETVFDLEDNDTDRSLLDQSSETRAYEVGAEYRHEIDAAREFSLLGLVRTGEEEAEARDFRLRDAGPRLDEIRLETDQTAEYVVFGQYELKTSKKHRWRFNFETAYSARESRLALQEADEGDLQLAADTRTEISELRIEPDIQYRAYPAENWRLSTELALEVSVLETQTDAMQRNSETFSFVKPTVNLQYTPTDRLRYQLQFTRGVSQLDFDDFAASFTRLDEDIRQGNPDLAPEQEWRVAGNLRYQFADGGGAFEVETFYRRLVDAIDRIVLEGSDESVAGNIGDADSYGIDVESSLRFSPLGLAEAVAEFDYEWRGSDVIDPFLEQTRRLSNEPEHRYEISFRHNLPALRAEYGLSAEKETRSQRVDIDEVRMEETDVADLSAYVEMETGFGPVARLEASNLLDQRTIRDRVRYRGNIADGVIREFEQRLSEEGVQLQLSLSGRL